MSIKWCDVRDVYVLTSVHDDTMLETRSRSEHQKMKPAAVVDYNKYKIGEDKSDQMLSYYTFQEKNSKMVEKTIFPYI